MKVLFVYVFVYVCLKSTDTRESSLRNAMALLNKSSQQTSEHTSIYENDNNVHTLPSANNKNGNTILVKKSFPQPNQLTIRSEISHNSLLKSKMSTSRQTFQPFSNRSDDINHTYTKPLQTAIEQSRATTPISIDIVHFKRILTFKGKVLRENNKFSVIPNNRCKRIKRTALHHKYIVRKVNSDKFSYINKSIISNKEYIQEFPSWKEKKKVLANISEYKNKSYLALRTEPSYNNGENNAMQDSQSIYSEPQWFRSESTGSVRRSVSMGPDLAGFTVRQATISVNNLSNSTSGHESSHLSSKDTISLARGSHADPGPSDGDHRIRHKISRAIRGRSRGVEVLADRSVLLPCDLRPPDPSDPPRLLLWLKAGSHMPIVSIDYRENGGGRVWRDPNSNMAVRLKLHMPSMGPHTSYLHPEFIAKEMPHNLPDLIEAGYNNTANIGFMKRDVPKLSQNKIIEWNNRMTHKMEFHAQNSNDNSRKTAGNPNSLNGIHSGQKYSTTILWHEDNNVAGSGNDLGSSGGLVLENSRLEDAGLYRCRVDFLQSPSRNVRVNLTVVDPVRSLSIHWKHEGRKGSADKGMVGLFKEGDNPSFECYANNGWPIPRVEWWEGSRRVDDTGRFNNGKAEVSTMRPGALTRHDFGRLFTCMSYNSNLTAPATATVAVHLMLPVVAAKIEVPANLVAGQTAEMHCTAWGSHPPPTAIWRLGRDTLSPSNKWVSDDGNVSVSVMSFTPQSQHDAQTLSCQVYNHQLTAPLTDHRVLTFPHANGINANDPLIEKMDINATQTDSLETGIAEDYIVLNVNYAPTVKAWLGRSLDGTKVKEGDDVYFECDVRSKPPPNKLIWTHNSEEVHATRGVLLTNLTLVLQSVTRRSAGRYACAAHNTLGHATSQPISLDIKFAPVCAYDLVGKHSVGKHENARVTCAVLANPEKVDFFWTFNNTAEVLNVPGDRYVVEGRSSVVNYTPVTDLDYGTLLCSAKNDIGMQSLPCVFQIVAAGKPGPPHNCQTEDVTLTSLNIACMQGDDGGLNQTFFLQVMLAGGSAVVSDQRNEEAQFFVSHLHPGTSHELRVTAENARGRSIPTVIFVATLQLSPASESNAEPTRGRGLGTGSGMSILIMVVIGCVPAAAVILLIVLVVRAVVTGKQRRSKNTERKSSSASTLGEGSAPAPDDDREDAAMLTTIAGNHKQEVPVLQQSQNTKMCLEKRSTCWCELYDAPHIAMAGCSTLSNKSTKRYQSVEWDQRTRVQSKMIQDAQLSPMAASAEGIHYIRTGDRKDYLPPNPVPPPLGYNQGYLPSQYPISSSPFRRREQYGIVNHTDFSNRGYATLDTRKSTSRAKLLNNIPSSGSFEMESNVTTVKETAHAALSNRLHQPRDSSSILQEQLHSLDKLRRQSSLRNLDGQESCV